MTTWLPATLIKAVAMMTTMIHREEDNAGGMELHLCQHQKKCQ
jgi:hypothetical protein